MPELSGNSNTTVTLRPVSQRVPVVFAFVAIGALLLVVGPLVALGLRIPWSTVWSIAREADTITMVKVTLTSAAWAAAITTVLGVALAVWLSGMQRGAGVVRLLVFLPLAMPPVVGGLALTAALGRRGITAPLLNALGLQFAFAFPGVVLAHVFVGLPFVVASVDSALRQIDREVMASAAGVGMSPWAITWKIVLPALSPSIAAGASLAFARSLGEFGTTLTFAGSLPGVTRTMPVGIYVEREVNQQRAYVLAAILIMLAVLSLIAAALPTFMARQPRQYLRAIGTLDVDRFRKLTSPTSGGVDVTVRYGSVDTRFPANKLTAIIGPNGSGKTTLTRLLTGRLRGATVTPKRGIVLLTQAPGLPPTATVSQAVTMSTGSATLTVRLLDAAGLTELAKVPVPALSGGQAAQVALVRALGARPAVLVLDEPLAAVDVESTFRWRQLLHATAGDRTTIMVTHDPIDLSGMADHVVVIDNGVVVADGAAEEIVQHPPTAFVSTLLFVNRIVGDVSAIENNVVTVQSGDFTIVGILFSDVAPQVGDTTTVTFLPNAVTLRTVSAEADGHHESARNVWKGTITSIDAVNHGIGAASHVVVTVSIGQVHIMASITANSALTLGLEVGMTVECVVKALNINVHNIHAQKKS